MNSGTASNHFCYSSLLMVLGGVVMLSVALHMAHAEMDTPAEPTPSIEPASPQKPAATDIFAVRTWAPPAVVSEPVKEVVPKRPQVPQLPFRFIGKIIDPDLPKAFLLAQGDRILSVSIGDLIDQTYLVEKYERAHLYFIYKPLKARQSLFVGEES